MSRLASDPEGGPAETRRVLDYFDSRRGIAALWFGMLAGPVSWYLHLNVSYALVRKICESGDVWLLHLTTLVTLLPAIAGVIVAWRSWRLLGKPVDAVGGSTSGRSRFMALGGMALSGFFALVLLVAWIPDFVIRPCGLS